MGSRHWVFICGVSTLLVLGIAAKGLLREATCADELLTLHCHSKKSVLAIHNAYVTSHPADGNISCSQQLEVNSSSNLQGLDIRNCTQDIRITINRRCSGLQRCNYSYQNETKRLCDIKRSVVVVRYDCVKESTLHKYCNTRLKLKEGYIASPGYPHFYPRLTKCRWDLEAADGYTFVIRPLHLHLRPPTVTHYFDEEYPIRASLHPDEIKCDIDYLRIEEGGLKITDMCGEYLESLEPVQLEASKGVALHFYAKEFFPGSGFIIHFKVKGCATLSPPEDVEFIGRNGTDVLYHCRAGLVFNDTLKFYRVLRCIGEHRWNDTLNMPCVDREEVRTIQSLINRSSDVMGKMEIENMTNDQAMGPPISEKRTSYIEDIVVPSVLMALLILGNTIIIVIIFAIRRRRRSKYAEEAAADTSVGGQKEEERLTGQTTSV